MSWNLNAGGKKSLSVTDAKALVVASGAPPSIVDYTSLAIDGLAAKLGQDVLVDVEGHGHLCDGNNSETSTASITVQKSA